jgi:fluoride ion exporter CrcB/FEX
MKRYVGIILFFVAIVAVSLVLAQIPAETIVATVGSENALYLMAVLGFIGGLTTFSGIPYHLILMSLTAGGLSPVLLGVATASGVVLGDSIMYVFSRKVATVMSKTQLEKFEVVTARIRANPQLITPGLFVYGLCSPFSNDFVVASMAIAGYSYQRIILPLYLGNIGYNIALGYLGYYAYDWIVGVVG